MDSRFTELRKLQTVLQLASRTYQMFLTTLSRSGRPKSLLDSLDASLKITPLVINAEKHDKVEPLDTVVRTEYETLLAADLSEVRVHTGQYASELTRASHALALTIGTDVYFADGRYAPYTEEGKSLLAHELAHVVQYLAGKRLVYLEDLAEAEYEGEAIEAGVAGIELSGVRRRDGAGAEDVVYEGEIFAGASAAGARTPSPSISDFSAGGRPGGIRYVTRNGEVIHLEAAEYARAVEEAEQWLQRELAEAGLLGDDSAYDELAMKQFRLIRGGY